MAANPSIQLGTDGNWAIKEDNLLAYKKDGNRFFNKEFDFSRGSLATFVGENGLIQESAINTPRIDFTNNATGHLLLEPQRQNVITYSEFDSESPTNWQTGFGTGTFSYDLVSYKSRPALKQRQQTEGRSYKAQNVTVSTSTTYTLSFYIDKENSINIDDSDIVCVIISSDDIGFPSRNYGDADENNRINFTFTTNTDTSIQIRIGLGSSGNQSGDKTLIFSMPQLEAGSYATSYIPTSGSAVTRSAETCDNSGSEQDFNDSEGVLYANLRLLAIDGIYKQITLNAGSPDNSIRLMFTDVDNQIRYFVRRLASTQADITHTLTSATQFSKISMVYKSNDFQLWVDGFQVGTDTSGTPPSGLNQLDFNDGGTSSLFRGKTKELAVFKRALTDLELESLTSWDSFIEMATELEYTIE